MTLTPLDNEWWGFIYCWAVVGTIMAGILYNDRGYFEYSAPQPLPNWYDTAFP